jgi:hypothetical protein
MTDTDQAAVIRVQQLCDQVESDYAAPLPAGCWVERVRAAIDDRPIADPIVWAPPSQGGKWVEIEIDVPHGKWFELRERPTEEPA